MNDWLVVGVVVVWVWLIKGLRLGFGLGFIGSQVVLVIIWRLGLR